MKKLLAFLTACLLMVSLTACGGTDDTEEDIDSGTAIESLADLEDKTIGVQLGTTGDIYVEEDLPNATLERYPKGADAVMALQQGKIDAVIIDDQPAKVFVSLNDDLKLLDEAFTVEDYAICVAKDNEALLAEINQAISELKEEGVLQAIVDYYIGQEEDTAPYASPEDVDYSRGQLVMATNATFPPYEYVEGGEIIGLDVDFARAICDKLGYELIVDDMEFDAIIIAVQSGKADFGAAGMTITEERLANINFTDTYYTGSQVVIVKK